MWGDASMRFIVKTDNDAKCAKKLQSFNPEFQGKFLTIELNSWHAFTALRKKFKTAPIIDNQYFKSKGYRWKRPMLDFRSRRRGRFLRCSDFDQANATGNSL